MSLISDALRRLKEEDSVSALRTNGAKLAAVSQNDSGEYEDLSFDDSAVLHSEVKESVRANSSVQQERKSKEAPYNKAIILKVAVLLVAVAVVAASGIFAFNFVKKSSVQDPMASVAVVQKTQSTADSEKANSASTQGVQQERAALHEEKAQQVQAAQNTVSGVALVPNQANASSNTTNNTVQQAYVDPLLSTIIGGVPHKEAEKQVSSNQAEQKSVVNDIIISLPAAKPAAPNGKPDVKQTATTKLDDYSALIANGESAKTRGDYKASLDYYLKAYEMKHEASIAEQAALLYVQTGDPTKALKMVKQAPIDSVSAISAIILEMVHQNWTYEANELIKYSRNLKDNGSLAFAEGSYHINNENYQKASIAFARSCALNSKNASYAYSYAAALELAEQYSAALVEYKRVLTLKPTKEMQDLANAKITSLKGYANK